MRALLIIALLATCTASAQDWTRTTAERVEGERKLVLTGTFTGADSAYVQVYHDGKELFADVFFRTWTLTLGEYTSYNLKFTDTAGAVKRLAIHELSDDMVEFYPPMEIDFLRTGNMVLIKPSTGKPDWMEFDVGLSRKAE